MPVPACCCEGCCVFEEAFDGEEVNANWTNAEALTLGSGEATLAEGETVGVSVGLTGPSGYATVACNLDAGESLEFKFAYVDANNHWLAIVYIDDYPGTDTGDTVFCELYEVVGGVTTHKGTRFYVYGSPPGNGVEIQACWYEGGRVRVRVSAGFPLIFEWPNNVSGGDRFEITATGGDIEINTVKLCKNYLENSTCTCQELKTCLQCNGSLNDTWQIEIIGGPSNGDVYIADRYLDWPFYPPGWAFTSNNTSISYWEWHTPRYSIFDGFYLFTIKLCVTGLANNQAQLIATWNPDGVGLSGTATFTLTDCAGPFDIVDGPVTYRLTPL